MVYGFDRMNIRIETFKTVLDWQKVRLAVDGPIWYLRSVWQQADEIISTGNFITIVAYEQTAPVGYILYNVTNQKTIIVGISKSIPEESKIEIKTALEAELQKAIEAQKK
jgi:predicted acetyltransferase